MRKLSETLRLEKIAERRMLLIGAVFVLGYAAMAIAGIELWQWSNSNQFCARVCHAVHPEEATAFQDSYHTRVQCAECHLGRQGTLQRLVLKTGHMRHLPETLFGQYERPLEWANPLPTDSSCELCHSAVADQGDVVKEFQRFLSDRSSTEQRTYLALEVEGGEERVPDSELDYIHWHATNRVEYIATDEHRQDIPWVRARLPSGHTVEYNDVTKPLSSQEMTSAERHVMTCIDCHNRVGHPFPPPERLVDDTLADGRLSTDLPFVKQEVLALLTADYSSQEDALAAVEGWKERYRAEHPDAATSHARQIDEAADVVRHLVTQVVFDEPGIAWRSFIDNGGHRSFPGCFRCHDGRHLGSGGESIRLHCNICHSIPETVGGGEGPPELPASTPAQPPSHLEYSFMADHRFQASAECEECHGEVEFGADDSSFCANSACHGQAWPQVDLDPMQEHTIPLEGQHAEVWCHDCHEGVRKPEYECANCHEPPPDHHGEECQDCHTLEGFASATLEGQGQAFDEASHLFPLDHGGANKDCSLCHPGSDVSGYSCYTCHSPERTKALHEAEDINDIFAKCTNCHP